MLWGKKKTYLGFEKQHHYITLLHKSHTLRRPLQPAGSGGNLSRLYTESVHIQGVRITHVPDVNVWIPVTFSRQNPRWCFSEAMTPSSDAFPFIIITANLRHSSWLSEVTSLFPLVWEERGLHLIWYFPWKSSCKICSYWGHIHSSCWTCGLSPAHIWSVRCLNLFKHQHFLIDKASN